MKNVTVSVFPESQEFDHEYLDSDLFTKHSRDIGKTERECWGFVFVANSLYLESIGGGFMLAIQKQERVLPSWAVNDELAEKVAEWEQATGQKVSAAAKRDMKEEIELDLLPRCFVRKKVFYAWLGKDRLLIDSKTPAVCDSITSLLREALGSMPCINVQPRSVPGAVMATWMSDAASLLPPVFALDSDTTLHSTGEDKAKIKIKDADLSNDSIGEVLSCCPMVSDIALTHNEAISFTLNEQLQLSKIKLSDTLQEQLNDDSEGDADAEQRATWMLEIAAINAALDDLFVAFGGLEGVDE